nr:basic proline-rich protein-like [Ovis aries]
MVGRLGPDLGARGPTRGGTRPCGGGGGTQPSGMARGLSSRPEGAAAPGRRARNLGRSEQTGSARRAGGRSPTPRRPSPEERCPGPRPGSAARARARGRAPSPGLQGAPPPHLRPGPRSRRSRGGTGTEAAAPCRARPRRPEALSLRLQRPAPLARSPVPRPFPLGQPRSPRRAGREAGLRPRLGEKRRREEPGLSGLGTSFIPALGPAKEPNNRGNAHPASHPLRGRFHSLTRSSDLGQGRGARQTLSRPALTEEPQPLLQKAGARAWPPLPRSRRASPWGPAPGPAAPAVLSPARGLLLGCPDLTDSGASGRFAARLFPGASQASLSAHKGWAWSRQSGRQASPLQRRRCTLPPLRPATRGSPGLPARVPCPHLPAAGQMLRARGPAPRSSSARPPSPRSPRLRGAPRARPAPGPRPRPTLPAARTRRTRTRVPAPPPPQRRRLPGRQHCAAAAPGTSPDAPGLQARPGKPLHRRHSATRGRLACGRPEIPRQPTPRPPTRATLIAGNRRPYGGAGPEEGPVAAAPLQVAPRGLVWGRGAASQRRWVLGSSAPPRPHLRPENRGSEQPSESG